ncbi:hypothetical protein [Allobaculum sp. Allo2]|uniref:hypothetical protein n=1 Tax=Allobaculum sp. Allo2 TaxID=2853432 RepID=UPI001F611D9B|nr:hypothetical protein [Allobaculum sp. Allo2]UNT92195.1 hypothetical protein KWG61_08135 [Allobaculum sp. Allo2]
MRFYFWRMILTKQPFACTHDPDFQMKKTPAFWRLIPMSSKAWGIFRYLNGSRSAQIELHCQEIGPASECGAAGLESGEDHCSGWLLFGETRFQMPSKRMRIQAACEQGEMDFTVACKSRSPIPVRKCSHLKTRIHFLRLSARLRITGES